LQVVQGCGEVEAGDDMLTFFSKGHEGLLGRFEVCACGFVSSEKDDYEEKKKEFESIIHPIFSKFGGGGQPGGPGGYGGPGGAGFGEDDEMPNHDDL